MRLADLNPQCWVIYADKDPATKGGINPTGEYEMAFDCPTCGAPYRCLIKVGPRADQARGVWSAESLSAGGINFDRLTIVQSINYTVAGHGRKHPTCGFHGHIVNGGIQP